MAEPHLADHATGPVPIFAASTPCGHLDDVFRPVPSMRCVAVLGGDGSLGLIMRDRFTQALTGPFGFGRALLAREPIGTLTDWTPLLLAAETSVDQACHALRQRQPDHEHDDILVWYPDGWIGSVPPAAIFDSVARLRADQATSDPLTGLANRRPFVRSLETACERANAGQCRVVVAFVDLDCMKHINDTLGHQIGDAVLVAVARGLRRAAPGSAVVARLGGDEFAVLVQSAIADQAMGMALGEQLRQAVATIDPTVAPGLRVRASVGVALSGTAADATAMLAAADTMMYQAKRSGGDTVAVTCQTDDPPGSRAPDDRAECSPYVHLQARLGQRRQLTIGSSGSLNPAHVRGEPCFSQRVQQRTSSTTCSTARQRISSEAWTHWYSS